MLKQIKKGIITISLVLVSFFLNLSHNAAADNLTITVTGSGGLAGLRDVSLMTCRTRDSKGECTEYLAVDNYEYVSDQGTTYCLDGNIPGPLGKNVSYSCTPIDGEYANGMLAIMQADNYSYFEKQMALRIYSSGGSDPISTGKDTYGNNIYDYSTVNGQVVLDDELIPINLDELDDTTITKYRGDGTVILEPGVSTTRDGVTTTWEGKFIDGGTVLSGISSLVSQAVKADDSVKMTFSLTGGQATVKGNDLYITVGVTSNAKTGTYKIVSFEITNYEAEEKGSTATIVIKDGKSMLTCGDNSSFVLNVDYKLTYTSNGDNVYTCSASGYQPMLLNMPGTPKKAEGTGQVEVSCVEECKWDTNEEKPTNCCEFCAQYPESEICTKEAMKNCEAASSGCKQTCEYFVGTGQTNECVVEGTLIYDDGKLSCPSDHKFTTDYDSNHVLACAIDEINGDLAGNYYAEGNSYCEVYCAHSVSYRFPGDGMTVNAGYRFAVGAVTFQPRIGGNSPAIETLVDRTCRTSKIDYESFIDDYEKADASAKENGQKWLERSKQIAASNEVGESGAICDIKNTKTCIDPSFGYSNGETVFKISDYKDAEAALNACESSTRKVCETVGGTPPPVNECTESECEYYGAIEDCNSLTGEVDECFACQSSCSTTVEEGETICHYEQVSSCTLTDCAKYETTIEKGKKVVVPSVSYEAYGTTYKTTKIDSCYTDIDYNNFFYTEPETYYNLYDRAISTKREAIRQIKDCLDVDKVSQQVESVEPEVRFSYDNSDINGKYYSYDGLLEIDDTQSTTTKTGSGAGKTITDNKILYEGKFPHDYECDGDKCYDAAKTGDGINEFSGGPVSEWYESSYSKNYSYKLADNAFPKIEKDSGISGLSSQNSAYSVGVATLPIHYTTLPGEYPYSLIVDVKADDTHIIANDDSNALSTYVSSSYICTYDVTAGLWEGKDCLNLIYRTISLSDPFAGFDGTTRKTGSNWCGGAVTYYKEVATKDEDGNDAITYEKVQEGGGCDAENSTVETYIHNSRGVKDDEIYTLDPMYTITLTPSVIKEVRRYNKQHKYSGFDGIMCSNGVNCKSNFIRQTIFDSIGTSCGIAGKQGTHCGKENKVW